ncbi:MULTISPECIES: flagellar basal-body MS-ring/collar protein FliF [Acidobacteriaceae]|uniref:flagellar basal-body MS-ring/collar protein FliF n=1 Tax=Acidobacteriaceae TaxID=204434 RepID=UPI00131B4714|nr:MULTISPECIES: flagellar basal-body MS-ring/collar protein FliF [Acidobacteriaceae]MDW5264325.1 flagellar basal-body MS-ring/collar protein FliF [Edaphobacter sp.]
MAEIERAGLEKTGQRVAGASGDGLVDRAAAMASAMQQRLMAMPVGKRTWLIASAAFLAAACVGMMWFAQRPDWRVLFSGLDGKDTQQVSQELAAAGISFQMTADGTGIEVPADMLDKARMEVAAKGMPQTGRLGFELFDKPNWVGSEFDERVNYQRALEGELEHTIETLDVVRSARVHLVLPQQSLFVSEEKAAKASVVLKLRRSTVDPEQADAIRSLVAGAVENLSPDQVTLVDADGRANLKPKSGDASKDEAEQEMEAKLVAMLEPLAGRDNVRATVNVSYDEGSEERTDEVYDPSQTATLSMQKKEEVSALPTEKASGVPGTASNSPAGAPAGSVAGSQAAAAPGTPPLLQKQALPVYPQQGNGRDQSIQEENGTYGVTKHLLHSEEGPGRVRRVTAAVVVNDRAMTEGTGKLEHTAWKPRSADEMRRLEQLAQAAVGYDARRGDQVVMENISFSTNFPEMKPPLLDSVMQGARTLAMSQPGMMRTVVIGICGVLLVLFVLRPVGRQVAATLREPLLLTAGANASVDLGNQQERMLPAEPEWKLDEGEDPIPLQVRSRAQRQQQGIFDYVSEHIRREPTQSTRLLEAWIGSTEDGE